MASAFHRVADRATATFIPKEKKQPSEVLMGTGVARSDCVGEVRLPISSAGMGGSSSREGSDEDGHNSRLSLGESQPGKGFQRFRNARGSWKVYYKDIFHTMLNMPAYRFLIVFFSVYLAMFFFFALLYLSLPDHCVNGSMGLQEAMWFSVQTASTMGYGTGPSPDPTCVSINMLIMINLIVASLVDYCLMGLVFARFASPMPYASTIRFSSHAVLHLVSDRGGNPLSGAGGSSAHLGTTSSGEHWCLSFRLANIRKHSLLKPELTLMLAVPTNTSMELRFVNLVVADEVTQLMNLKLGLVASVKHIITPDSPLYGLSLDQMESRGIEVLCMLDGVDPMTSNTISAHSSFSSDSIRMNEHFETIRLKKNRKGDLGLDFGQFDSSVVASSLESGNKTEILLPVAADGAPLPSQAAAASHMAELRRHTIRDLSADLTMGTSPRHSAPPAQAVHSQAVLDLIQAVLSEHSSSQGSDALKEKARAALHGP